MILLLIDHYPESIVNFFW